MKRFIGIVCILSAMFVVGSAALHAAEDQDSIQAVKAMHP